MARINPPVTTYPNPNIETLDPLANNLKRDPLTTGIEPPQSKKLKEDSILTASPAINEPQ